MGLSGCEDDNPLGEDFGIELLEPVTVTWPGGGEYHASSGDQLIIHAKASLRVDWRVEITSDGGGRVVHDDTIIQSILSFSESLPFTKTPSTPNIFAPGDTVTVRVITIPEIKPSQAERAVFQFVIQP